MHLSHRFRIYYKIVIAVIFFFTYLRSHVSAENHFFPITKNNAEQINLGKKLYDNYCITCHAHHSSLTHIKNDKLLQGFDNHRAWDHDDKTLFNTIKYGLKVAGWPGIVMRFKDRLQDDEIVAIIAYFKTFWTDEDYNRQINIR